MKLTKSLPMRIRRSRLALICGATLATASMADEPVINPFFKAQPKVKSAAPSLQHTDSSTMPAAAMLLPPTPKPTILGAKTVDDPGPASLAPPVQTARPRRLPVISDQSSGLPPTNQAKQNTPLQQPSGMLLTAPNVSRPPARLPSVGNPATSIEPNAAPLPALTTPQVVPRRPSPLPVASVPPSSAALPRIPAAVQSAPVALPRVTATTPSTPVSNASAPAPRIYAVAPAMPAALPRVPVALPKVPVALPRVPVTLPRVPVTLPAPVATAPRTRASIPAIPVASQLPTIIVAPSTRASQVYQDESVDSTDITPTVLPKRLARVEADEVVADPMMPDKERNTVRWLPSQSSMSQQKATLKHLREASVQYYRRAYASAEQSAWKALQSAAEGFDIADRQTRPGERLRVSTMGMDLEYAKTAFREARDFSGKYGFVDFEGVRRIVRSHQTEAMKQMQDKEVASRDAIDLYMNDARIRLARLAAVSSGAAQAMDLLAAVYIGRDGENLLAGETALTLRRAALQGQPGNASLALQLGKQLSHLGLDEEAKWALNHSMKIERTAEAGQLLATVTARAGNRELASKMMQKVREEFPQDLITSRAKKSVPKVTRVSPETFAAMRRAPLPSVSASAPVQASAAQPADAPAGVKPVGFQKSVGGESTTPPPTKRRRFFDSLKKIW